MTIEIKNSIENLFNTPGKRLKYIRGLLRLSRLYIQEKYGIPEVTLKSWENEKVELSISGIQRCIDAYLKEGVIVSSDWILKGIGMPPKSSQIITSYFSYPSLDFDKTNEDDELQMIKEVDFFQKSYNDAVIMTVSNNEMSPYYYPGDIIGGRFRFLTEIETAIGRNCIILLDTGERFFRRLVKNKSGSYNLTCLNPEIDTIEPVMYNVKLECVAPVIWHRSRNN